MAQKIYHKKMVRFEQQQSTKHTGVRYDTNQGFRNPGRFGAVLGVIALTSGPALAATSNACLELPSYAECGFRRSRPGIPI
jgi:hypothetical protein